MMLSWQPTIAAFLLLFALLFPGGKGSISGVVNSLFARKLALYRESLPEQLQQLPTVDVVAQQLRPTLRFLYYDSWLEILAHGFVVPELGSLFDGEAAMLFGNLTYIKEHSQELPFDTSLHMLLATLNSFDPTRYTSILTAYPISRRVVAALVLERYLEVGSFTEAEAQLIANISRRAFDLHRQAAKTKRIIEFFHVSKSGGTTFCQLGRLNGCKTESFGYNHNCMIKYFRDAPRWTRAGALGDLSARYGDPWCARFGRNYTVRWHCRARRAHMTKNRFNFYSNELVMHSHNRSWVGVHPCREFLNVVIFREPEPRILSHMQNILKEYVRYYGMFNASVWSAFDPTSPDQWRDLAVPVFDNYVIRSLLGGVAYNMPAGAVNATHLLAAKVVTLQFEVLLTLGLSPAARELTGDIFALGLGWNTDLRHLHVRATQQRPVPSFVPPVVEAVRLACVLDRQLYEFALVLQLLDAIMFAVAQEAGGVGVEGAQASQGVGGDAAAGAGVGNSSAASALAGAQVQVPFAAGSGRTLLGTVINSGWRRRRTCGYVGVRPQPPGPRPPPGPPAQPALHVEVESLLPGGGVERLPVEGLGSREIAGGRWFNGEFYLNATAAEEAALEVARATAKAMVEAAAVQAAAAEASAPAEAAGGGGAAEAAAQQGGAIAAGM